MEAMEKKILVIIDKMDKIGADGVKKELANESIPSDKVDQLFSIYQYAGSNEDTIGFLTQQLDGSATGSKGIEELNFIIRHVKGSAYKDLQTSLKIDLTLARGLEYYTGTIFEVKAPPEVSIGSIGGGGRYAGRRLLPQPPGPPGAAERIRSRARLAVLQLRDRVDR